MKNVITISAAMLLLTATLGSCTSNTALGAGFGGVIGSAVGGIVGGPRGSDIGTLVGLATGAAVGAAADEAANQRELERAARRSSRYSEYDSGTYYTPRATTPSEREKAARVRRYHDRVARRQSSTGYSLDLPARERRVTRSADEPRDTPQKADTPQYDDRIEMK